MGFPKGFIWGSATSALQIEGAHDADGRGASMWDRFCADHPELIHGRASPVRTCDHYHRWPEDVDLIAAMGHNGYRFSISWPRLYPHGDAQFNEQGALFYDRLIDALLESGIEPCVTLYHWDLPDALARQRGWEDKRVIGAFLIYADRCFRRWGDRAKRWITINEPGLNVLNGYVTGLHPPARHDYLAAVQAAHNQLVAHARAVRLFHDLGVGGEIGLALNLSQVYPATDSAEDQAAAEIADGILNRWFIEPALLGRYPADALRLYRRHGLLPDWSADELAMFQEDRVDFIGINYLHPHHASAEARSSAFSLDTAGTGGAHNELAIQGLFRMVPNQNGRYTQWGWEIAPKGLYDLLIRVQGYGSGVPVYITGNGIGREEALDERGEVSDEERMDYIHVHLQAAQRAIADGVNLRGYYYWSLMDNFSWLSGYKQRYGLLYVDHETGERVRKRSSYWYERIARTNQLVDPRMA